ESEFPQTLRNLIAGKILGPAHRETKHRRSHADHDSGRAKPAATFGRRLAVIFRRLLSAAARVRMFECVLMVMGMRSGTLRYRVAVSDTSRMPLTFEGMHRGKAGGDTLCDEQRQDGEEDGPHRPHSFPAARSHHYLKPNIPRHGMNICCISQIGKVAPLGNQT